MAKDGSHASPFISLKVTDAGGKKLLHLCAERKEKW